MKNKQTIILSEMKSPLSKVCEDSAQQLDPSLVAALVPRLLSFFAVTDTDCRLAALSAMQHLAHVALPQGLQNLAFSPL